MKSILPLALIPILVAHVAFFAIRSDAEGVANCTDVLYKYSRTPGYPVFDCYDDHANNFTYWRIDRKLQWIDARQACRGAGLNADIASIHTFSDQKILNDLYMAKYTLDTWMWIGISRDFITNKLMWVDGTNVTQMHRFYPYPNSWAKNCGVMLILANPNGDKDVSGTFWYTVNCAYTYIVACKANSTAAR